MVMIGRRGNNRSTVKHIVGIFYTGKTIGVILYIAEQYFDIFILLKSLCQPYIRLFRPQHDAAPECSGLYNLL